MNFKDFYKREKHVALNAQPRNFRIAKWIVIVIVAIVLYIFFGWKIVVLVLLSFAVAGTCLHFLLRWKTDGWTKSWGPYKRIKLDGE